jgi:uncharacterized membrane protein
VIFVYPKRTHKSQQIGSGLERKKGNRESATMKEAKDVLRIVGVIFLSLFVIVVGGHLLMAAIGVTLGIAGFVFGLAVLLIKLAVGIAVVYLILVGIRALLR